MLCKNISIEIEKPLSFTTMEKNLVCGEGDDGSSPWKNIPLSQAQSVLRSFLQARGYLNPQFMTLSKNGEIELKVAPGTLTLITKVEILGSPIPILIAKKRGYISSPLTPQKLNELQAAIELDLRFAGYPCPLVKAEGNRDSGEVRVQVTSGPLTYVSKVIPTDSLGLTEETLRRFDAFHVGDPIDQRELTLTERRILTQDILSSTHFSADCEEKNLGTLRHYVSGGPPRTLRIGFGLNTEEILLSRLSWRHARLDRYASSSQIDAQAGFHTQSLSAEMKLYGFLKNHQYLRPHLFVSRDLEDVFESQSFNFGLTLGSTGDTSNLGWLAEFGPSWEIDRTVVGAFPGQSQNALLSGTIQFVSHDFEYYLSNPRTGFRVFGTLDLTNAALISSLTAQKITLGEESLWNVGDFDPPIFILGWRSGLNLTLTDSSLQNPLLSVPFRNYLGGSKDLRGFDRLELPSSGLGALSSLYSSLEGRFGMWIKPPLQPFLFLDFGELGSSSLALSPPFYLSPGFGLRWPSPIGVFRSTLSRGYVLASEGQGQDRQHFQFYLSYGEEF